MKGWTVIYPGLADDLWIGILTWIGRLVKDLQICPGFASDSWIGDGLTAW